MITLTFDDGMTWDFPSGVTGVEIAQVAPEFLGKNVLAMVLDGCLVNLTTNVTSNAKIEFVTGESPEGLQLIRHACAHVLAEAVQLLYSDVKLAIGPTIKDGFYYDFYCSSAALTVDSLSTIEAKMREIIANNNMFAVEILPRDELISLFMSKGEFLKVQLINEMPDEENIKIYRQGDWFDLCRGPHIVSVGQIGQHFRLTKVSGAYWRGDASGPMLSRIYGTVWATENALQAHLDRLSEAEKRDHRKLGPALDLFHFQESGPGVVFWHPKGWLLYKTVLAYLGRRLAGEYEEVNSPQILHKSLWEESGHIEWYKENMFEVKSLAEDKEVDRSFVLKPMNCPGHILLFNHKMKSYRDLPVRMAEFGVVHRYEPSGAMHGLMRLRGFTQDDAHIFCSESQMFDEFLKLNNLILSVYRDFGFSNITLKLSTRPKKRVGSNELWDKAEKILLDVLKQIMSEPSSSNLCVSTQPEEGAFYGPKFDYMLTDAIGREWQCGTIQVDFNLPSRFGVFYVDIDNARREPVMIHRALFGSIERFIGILIEHHAGHLPLWLAPVQVVVASISSDSILYSEEIANKLVKLGLRVKVDVRNETINYKVREHSLSKVPVVLVAGSRESQNSTVSVRWFGRTEVVVMSLEDATRLLLKDSTPPDLLCK